MLIQPLKHTAITRKFNAWNLKVFFKELAKVQKQKQ